MKLTVKIEAFKPLKSHTLVGFATIVIPELRLRIIDLTVHQKNDARWVGLPARPQLNRDGTVRHDDRGKTAYSAVLEFTDKATRDAFSHRVTTALAEFAPEAFDRAAA
jgi:hypothetical protein